MPDIGDRLERLFNRGADWGLRDTAWENRAVVKALQWGRIRTRLVRLSITSCRRAKRHPVVGQESQEHLMLKAAALLWMKGQGARDATLEAWCPVGKADVYSAKRNWVVECGNTPISKLGTATQSREPIRFTLLPYQRLTRDDGTVRRLIAIDFVWDADVREAVNRHGFDEAMAAMEAAAHSGQGRTV